MKTSLQMTFTLFSKIPRYISVSQKTQQIYRRVLKKLKDTKHVLPLFHPQDQYVNDQREFDESRPYTMNAFELITLSQGFNLSALFDRRQVSLVLFRSLILVDHYLFLQDNCFLFLGSCETANQIHIQMPSEGNNDKNGGSGKSYEFPRPNTRLQGTLC